jgi:hypothetical protein
MQHGHQGILPLLTGRSGALLCADAPCNPAAMPCRGGQTHCWAQLACRHPGTKLPRRPQASCHTAGKEHSHCQAQALCPCQHTVAPSGPTLGAAGSWSRSCAGSGTVRHAAEHAWEGATPPASNSMANCKCTLRPCNSSRWSTSVAARGIAHTQGWTNHIQPTAHVHCQTKQTTYKVFWVNAGGPAPPLGHYRPGYRCPRWHTNCRRPIACCDACCGAARFTPLVFVAWRMHSVCYTVRSGDAYVQSRRLGPRT